MAHDNRQVWVIDDDRSVRFVLAEALREAGYDVLALENAAAAQAAFVTEPPPALVFTDVRMPGQDGLKLLEAIKRDHPELPVVVMSAYTDVASTAGAFRGGALEFLSKPFDLDDAVALAQRTLSEPEPEPNDAGTTPTAEEDGLIGEAPAMRALFRSVGRLAQAPLNVLIIGETGTGKELVASALHRESPRARKPFVALNTAAIPAELLESELFGHEAGAFTGATRRHIGRFEQADGGTLFLDEIGDMPASLQTRLLRVLAEGEFFRVGGRELIAVDVRVIAATHQDLENLVREGRFRADLLHRLDVARLTLPALRARREDIGLLAARFLSQAARQLEQAPKRLTDAALARLRAHDWPGNVRELENLCWRLAALASSERIGVAELAEHLRLDTTVDATPDWTQSLADWARAELAAGTPDRSGKGLHASALEAFDRTLLQAALDHTHGHRQKAAELLGLGRNTVTRKLGSRRAPAKDPGAGSK
jgi:two-component system nitrogen regulation response regulator GlnG